MYRLDDFGDSNPMYIVLEYKNVENGLYNMD